MIPYAVLSFMSHGKFWCAEQDGTIVVNRTEEREWERFSVIPHDDGCAFKTHHGKYVGAESTAEKKLVAKSNYPIKFKMKKVNSSGDDLLRRDDTITLELDDLYVCVDPRDSLAYANRHKADAWEKHKISNIYMQL